VYVSMCVYVPNIMTVFTKSINNLPKKYRTDDIQGVDNIGQDGPQRARVALRISNPRDKLIVSVTLTTMRLILPVLPLADGNDSTTVVRDRVRWVIN